MVSETTLGVLIAFGTVSIGIVATLMGWFCKWVWEIKTQDLPEIEQHTEQRFDAVERDLAEMKTSYFGVKADDGDMGMVNEFRSEIIDLCEEVEDMSDSQRNMYREMRQAHNEVHSDVKQIITVLEDEDINGDLPDIEEYHNDNE